VRPPEVFALSREAETFQKELHFVQIFLKSHLTLDYLIAFQIVFLKCYQIIKSFKSLRRGTLLFEKVLDNQNAPSILSVFVGARRYFFVL
jgi:hypothetical protein